MMNGVKSPLDEDAFGAKPGMLKTFDAFRMCPNSSMFNQKLALFFSPNVFICSKN